MARKLAAVMFLLGILQTTSALSLGLGALQLQSFLNEPLKASVDLLDMGGLHEDEVIIRLASRDDFEKFGVDRPYFLSSIKFEVSAEENGTASIILSSDEAVVEPYLDFILEARWPSGRLLREYTVLIDPASFSEVETVAVSAAQRVDEIERVSISAKKNDEVISSGTSVEIRRSDLAPGDMPQRDYNSTTVLSPVPGSRYMISREDTLWRIASLAKPRGASVQQTMLDIQRLNPDAFVNANINSIKAGYIVDLPSESEISSADVSAALAEVRQQNAAWREGRDVALNAASGPSLTISVDTKDDAATESVGTSDAAAGSVSAQVAPKPLPVAKANSNDEAAVSSLVDEMQERLSVAEQQLETLQSIINLKDEQIAALQSALVAAGAVAAEDAGADALAEASDEILPDGDATTMIDVDAPRDSAKPAVKVVEPDAESLQEKVPVDVSKVVPVIVPETESSGGGLNGLLYLLGVVVLGVVAFIFVRRRKEDGESISHVPGSRPFEDVFSTVQLKEQGLNVEESEDKEDVKSAAVGGDFDASERHDDEPASHTEAGSILADVDIYVLYGRHSQAIDLLNNAIASEPDNPLYRLKLLEVEAQSNGHPAANFELDKEEQNLASEAGELSFAADFSAPDTSDLDSEDLVIAADGYGLSTKLDLARAYIDMGDDDGARQILEEVVAEGSDDLKAEASVLLDRIGQ